MIAIPDSINWNYIADGVRCYNAQPSDDLLYRIGSHANILILSEDCEPEGKLTSQQRFYVLDWVLRNGFKVKANLALLIFGQEQLTEWLERSRTAYPDYDFYLPFEYHDSQQSGWESGINFSLCWIPKPGAPVPNVEMDFPHALYWESGEMFWANWMPEGNQFGLLLSNYPRQASFTFSDVFCVEGDHYTTLTDEEAGLVSVAKALEIVQ